MNDHLNLFKLTKTKFTTSLLAFFLTFAFFQFISSNIKAQNIDTTDSVHPKPFITKRVLLPDINGQLDVIDIIKESKKALDK